MLTPVRVADYVLDAIAARIGAVAPEQGGALLGLPGVDYVTGFLHDAGAATTGSRYQNTDRLIAAIAEREGATAARFKGIVHSHPPGMPVPSGQDRSEYAESLRLNPHLARYLAPIVTHDVDTPLAGHEVRLGPARISFYGAHRAPDGVQVEPVRPVVVPIVRMLRRAGVQPNADPAAVDVDGAALLATQARIPGFGEVTVLFGADFPATAPILLPGESGDGLPVLEWDLGLPPLERLAAAMPALRRGRRARPRLRPRSPSREADDASHDANPTGALFARTEGLLSPTLAGRRVLIVGAGSVGSYVAETMARSGVGAFTIVDPDEVEPANLGRGAYRVADVGLDKARALADLVLSVNPGAHAEIHIARHEDVDLGQLVSASDLVVAATDDPQAQTRLGHFAYWHARPTVFPGLYQGAHGGEVIVAAPGTACFTCATGGVRADLQETASGSVTAATDYGTGRLIAEPGLLPDIHQVSAAAVKIALGLLHDAADGSDAARFAQGILKSGTTYAVFGHEPDYWIFADLLRGAPAQYAYQSLWLSVQSRPDCPVCGDPQGRTDPSTYQEPDVDLVRALRDAE
ncbi:MAG: thiamine biosynthesis protein ThiF [Catenulispora sp.]|nr:thiamine biosynthesis protein ThiF [Catenulispora sp.]